MELSRKAEKSYLIRRLSGVAPYDFPYRKKILKSMSLKQLRVVNKIAENINISEYIQYRMQAVQKVKCSNDDV